MATNDNGKDFGNHLKALRTERKLSQRDLAKLSGVSQRMIAHYETHPGSIPPLDKALALAKALNISAETLAGIQTTNRRPAYNSLLWKQFQLLEALPKKERDVVIKQIAGLAAQAE